MMPNWKGRSALMGTVLVLAAALTPAAQGQAIKGSAPDSFDVDASAAPVLVGLSAPSALPLDVAAGVGFSSAKLNSQPKGTAEAAPGYVPLLAALPLLGGTGALPAIGARLLPGLIVGFPTIIGLPPLPVDPGLLAIPPLPPIPAPDLPPLECFANIPGDATPVTCGGPSQEILGFNIAAASGRASTTGDLADPSTLRVDAAVRGAGLGAAPENTLLPMRAGTVASSAASYVQEGRVIGAASTAVQDLSIAGIIKIPLLQTSISAALDGTAGNAAATGERCTLAGATIAGVPVSIDGDGVHLAGQTQPLNAVLDPVGKVVQSTLDQLGVTLKAAAGSADPGNANAAAFPGTLTLTADGTKLAASLSCLEISYRIPTSGTTLSVAVGNAKVVMQAFTGAEASTGNATDGTTSSTATNVDAPAAGGELSLDPVGVGQGPPPPAPPAAGSGAPAPSITAFQRVDFGWKLPYAPFGLLALALPLSVWTRRIGPLPVGRATRPLRRIRGRIGAAPLPRPTLRSRFEVLVRRLRP